MRESATPSARVAPMRSAKVINLANANLSKVSGKSLQKDQGAVKHPRLQLKCSECTRAPQSSMTRLCSRRSGRLLATRCKPQSRKHLRTKRAAVACDATVTVLSSCACPMASSSDCASCTVSDPSNACQCAGRTPSPSAAPRVVACTGAKLRCGCAPLRPSHL